MSFTAFAGVKVSFFDALIVMASSVAGLRPSRSGLSLGGVDKFEPVSGGGDMDHAEEAVGELIVAGGDGTVDLEMAEHALAGRRTPALCWMRWSKAIHDGRPVHRGGLVHHSDRGSQYVSIKYTERLAEAGIEPSVGSVGDSYDNALAETINGPTRPK